MKHAIRDSRRTPRAAAAALACGVFFAVAVVAALVLQSRSAGITLTATAGLVPLLATQAVGLLIAVRRPESRMGWIVCALGMVLALQSLLTAIVVSSPSARWWFVAALWLDGKSFLLLWGGVIAVLLHFPTGELPSPRWKIVRRAAVAAVLGGVALSAVKPGPLAESVPAGVANPANPTALPADVFDRIAVLEPVGLLLLVAAMIGSLASLVVRYRSSSQTQKLQIRWVVAACGAFVTVLLVNVVVRHVVPAWLDATDVVAGLAFTLIPVAVGIAVLRRRLYDIDRVINRTVVYSALTAFSALAYAAVVTGVRAVTEPYTGDAAVAVAVSTLAVAALFRPARVRIQDAVDRRFNRARYDAAATIQSFSARLRDEIDIETLRTELLRVVGTTMQPRTSSLWLREAAR